MIGLRKLKGKITGGLDGRQPGVVGLLNIFDSRFHLLTTLPGNRDRTVSVSRALLRVRAWLDYDTSYLRSIASCHDVEGPTKYDCIRLAQHLENSTQYQKANLTDSWVGPSHRRIFQSLDPRTCAKRDAAPRAGRKRLPPM